MSVSISLSLSLFFSRRSDSAPPPPPPNPPPRSATRRAARWGAARSRCELSSDGRRRGSYLSAQLWCAARGGSGGWEGGWTGATTRRKGQTLWARRGVTARSLIATTLVTPRLLLGARRAGARRRSLSLSLGPSRICVRAPPPSPPPPPPPPRRTAATAGRQAPAQERERGAHTAPGGVHPRGAAAAQVRGLPRATTAATVARSAADRVVVVVVRAPPGSPRASCRRLALPRWWCRSRWRRRFVARAATEGDRRVSRANRALVHHARAKRRAPPHARSPSPSSARPSSHRSFDLVGTPLARTSRRSPRRGSELGASRARARWGVASWRRRALRPHDE